MAAFGLLDASQGPMRLAGRRGYSGTGFVRQMTAACSRWDGLDGRDAGIGQLSVPVWQASESEEAAVGTVMPTRGSHDLCPWPIAVSRGEWS